MLKPSSLVIAAVLGTGLVLGGSVGTIYNYRQSLVATDNTSIEDSILSNTGLIVYNGREMGSGVAYRKDGKLYVITAAHVVDDEVMTLAKLLGKEEESKEPHTWGKGSVSVVFFNPDTSERKVQSGGTVIFVDEVSDFAIIEVGSSNDYINSCLDTIKGCNFTYTVPHVGSKVFASGFPAGDEFTLTAGIVSHSKRVLEGLVPGAEYIATDTPITHGSSGGGLYLQKSGSCIGIVVMGNIRNLQGYCVPMWVIKKSLEEKCLLELIPPSA